MKKVCYLVFCLIIISLVTGCISDEALSITESELSESTSYVSNETSEYSSIYIDVFDAYFSVDTALHADMKFLAIDMDTLNYATDGDKSKIIEHFMEKFNIEVKDASFDDLIEQGLVKDGNAIDGVLLSIDKIDVNNSVITVEGSKFRSGNGANGFKSVLKKSGDIWKLKNTEMTWIS